MPEKIEVAREDIQYDLPPKNYQRDKEIVERAKADDFSSPDSSLDKSQ